MSTVKQQPAMVDFKQLQQQFAAYIRAPHTTAPPAGIEQRRLQVYSELFFNNVKGFLDTAFPVLKTLYSEPDWTGLARQFFSNYACHSPYFLLIAEQFVSFLQDYQPTAADPPFLAELAHYEWAELYIATVSSEQQLPALDQAELNGDALDNTRLQLSELAMLCAYQWPVQQICVDFQPTEPAQPVFFLLYRNKQDEVKFVQLSQATLLLLNHLAEQPGLTFGQLISAISPQLPGLTAQQLQQGALPLIRDLAGKGAICRYLV
ncbi:HvfC family RiPP maturation protein [Arsukibacterium indicum]|uniref:DNA-binding domain-containing protein n=1 Tax=Arsukibacterium indicum TaxID=2848612 RepID=A0ABS6ML71_9GAMM|nr:putative DNA-binding domain-containing protein [Arsukibacterium indicum]MBV2129568.1 putative DNA-binding domain-containing protein [Arsukibacterium indicum]